MADIKDTWDLTHMFESVQAWRDGMDYARVLADELAQMQGTITKDADTLYTALQRNDKLGKTLTALFVYAKMYFDQNMANGEAKDIYDSQPKLAQLAGYTDYAKPGVINPNGRTIMPLVQAEIQAMLEGKQMPQEAADKSAAAIENMLQTQ